MWILIFVIFVIYLLIGYDIYRKRSVLGSFARPSKNQSTVRSDHGAGADDIVLTGGPAEMVTTDIHVTTEPVGADATKDKWEPYTIQIESKANGPRNSRLMRPTLVSTNSHGHNAQSGSAGSRAAQAYARCAFFFFLAMLVTWVSFCPGACPR